MPEKQFLDELMTAIDDGKLTELLQRVGAEVREVPPWSIFRTFQCESQFQMVQLCRRAYSAGISAGQASMRE